MSLLLDALKKAADDKQKALQAESKDSGSSDSNPSSPDRASAEDAVNKNSADTPLSLDDHDMHETADISGENKDEQVGELTLEDVSEVKADNTEEEASATGNITDEYDSTSDEKDIEQKQVIEPTLEKISGPGSEQFTVSDDALSMLIYKTNRDVKQSRKILVTGVLVTSLIILLSGGSYYYLDMQTEISDLERKHQLAMRSMNAKTNIKKMPGQQEIIRNLIGKHNLQNKFESTINNSRGDKAGVKTQATVSKKKSTSAPILSIQKTKKIDRVSDMLDAAWLSYDSGNYEKAKSKYHEVLLLEKENRDALLGLGAIAVIQKNNLVAREIYLSVLEQDPRNSMATAGLAQLHDESSLKSDEEYLLSVLKKNPGAQHLSFALGNNYALQNRWKSAQQYYFDAWQSDPENADYIFNLAVSMDQLNKLPQAISFYKDSLIKSESKQVSFSREAVRKRINELIEL